MLALSRMGEGTDGISNGVRSRAITRVASAPHLADAVGPLATMMNSSLPLRPTQPSGPTVRTRRAPISTRSSSPAACPNASLMSLKSSMSRKITANSLRVPACRGQVPVDAVDDPDPARQAGQQVDAEPMATGGRPALRRCRGPVPGGPPARTRLHQEHGDERPPRAPPSTIQLIVVIGASPSDGDRVVVLSCSMSHRRAEHRTCGVAAAAGPGSSDPGRPSSGRSPGSRAVPRTVPCPVVITSPNSPADPINCSPYHSRPL